MTWRVKSLRTLVLALLLTSLSAVGVSVAEPTRTLATLTGVQERDGATADIQAHHRDGSWLVVMLWATDCHICREEFPKYSAFHRANIDANSQVLGIALDGVGNNAGVDAFYKDTGATFPTLSANLGHFAQSYQALTGEALMGTPTFMLFNPKGKLVGLNPGPLRIEALKRFIAQKSAA